MTTDIATSNPLDDLNRELALLLKQRQLAIERCEFQKAKAIDCHTDRLKEQIEMVKAKTDQIHSSLAFDRKKEEVKMEAIKALNFTNDQIFQIKAEFQERIIALHQKHTEQAERLAVEYATELEMETTRSNPESRYLLNQAKFNAKTRNYSTAEALYNESNKTRNDVSEKRQSEVHEKYDTAKLQIEKAHERELKTCKEKEERKIITTVENFKKYMAKCKRFLVKSATDLGITLTPEDTTFLDDIVKEMNSYEVKTDTSATPSSTRKVSMNTTPRNTTGKSFGKTPTTTPKSSTRRMATSPRTLDTKFNGSIRSASRMSNFTPKRVK